MNTRHLGRLAAPQRALSGVLLGALLGALPGAALPASAAEWTVDPAKSAIRFSGVQVGVPFTGRFERFEAAVEFDPAKPEAGHATVLVDLASARTGDVQRDEALPQKDWFDVKGSSTARFEATRFVDKGQGDYAATGTLTIRGTSRPVTLPFHLAVEGGAAHATGRVGLVRTEFGVGQGAWASGQWVALDVGVEVDLVATARSASGH
ncbi:MULTISPECIES: YceI family protein [Methylobacterium]|uniref:YceI family protein n=1 Tax=Methylobacterium longum TaxID=767694 RepID=A0ABT8AVG6_9HYPH|nr:MULTISPECIES: YceI family protein [Methylobacterium]MCJ2097510.1 YceI family protein [Methylobacterium sp. E-046]MDN3573843.1 YceI family protein [Methylobacterium longum]GJE14157.1 Protein YceI [Methylobacterium longum]